MNIECLINKIFNSLKKTLLVSFTHFNVDQILSMCTIHINYILKSSTWMKLKTVFLSIYN